jgi:outer membrane protein
MKQPLLCLLLLIGSHASFAQEKWDLQKAVNYAITNNISVKQADLQTRFSALTHLQNQSSKYPTLNFSLNSGYSFGRSENPTTGILEDNNFFNSGLGVQSGVTLFNWFSLKHTIEASRISAEADKAQLKATQDDVALNVAVAYLQILLAKEQARIADIQVKQTLSQYEQTRKRVDAGALPELNAVELEAQIARDSTALIQAQTTEQQNILQLKALLNLDAGAPFEVEAPPVDQIPVESLAELQPERVYNLALQNLSQQRVTQLRIESAQRSVSAARANMYPTISAFANLNSSYVYFRRATYAPVVSGFQPSGLRVDLGGGNFYDVQQPIVTQGGKVGYFTPDPLFNQLNTNFGQGIGLGVQVPIFNGRQARSGWDRAKLNVQQLTLQNEGERQTLKQDIYRAYTDATAAIQRFNAARRSVAAAEKAYDFAQKRYNLALLSTYDLINTQNNLLRSRIELVSAQFDYVFRLKLLEFYKGQGLRLE